MLASVWLAKTCERSPAATMAAQVWRTSFSMTRALLSALFLGLRGAVDQFAAQCRVDAAAIQVPVGDGHRAVIAVGAFKAAVIFAGLRIQLQVDLGVEAFGALVGFVLSDIDVGFVDFQGRAFGKSMLDGFIDIGADARRRIDRHDENVGIDADDRLEAGFGVAQGLHDVGHFGGGGRQAGVGPGRCRLRDAAGGFRRLIWESMELCSSAFCWAICSNSRWRSTSR